MKTKNMMIVGVGGQGTGLAADLLAGGIACYAARRMTRNLPEEPFGKPQETPAEFQAEAVNESAEL